MSARRLLVLIVTGAALVLAALLVARRGAREAMVSEAEQMPLGHWHLAPHESGESFATDAEQERAQLLSSPYLAGSRLAEGQSGVTVYDPERSFPGLDFYVSGHAAEAILMDAEGHGVARWAYPADAAFPETAVALQLDYWRRAQVLPDGSLVALYQGLGIVRIDRRSRRLWAYKGPVFNDLFVAPDGSVYTLSKRPTVDARVDPTHEILEDFITRLDPEGHIAASISLLDALTGSPFADLLHPVAESGDVFHSNTITPLGGGLPAPFADGTLLVSIRQLDLVGVVDPATAAFTWARRGPWSHQHEPVALPDGGLLVFDNRGGPGGSSRAIEVDPASGEVLWELGDLHSRESGAVQRLGNGNTLVTESERGRALEVTRDREIVWEFWSPHRAGRHDELVATLFDMVRLPQDCCPFLDDETTAPKAP